AGTRPARGIRRRIDRGGAPPTAGRQRAPAVARRAGPAVQVIPVGPAGGPAVDDAEKTVGTVTGQVDVRTFGHDEDDRVGGAGARTKIQRREHEGRTAVAPAAVAGPAAHVEVVPVRPALAAVV